MENMKKSKPKKEVKTDFVLENVPDDNFFNVIDGSSLGNLVDLANAMELMNDDTYYHHANEGKNDFASWVNDCMGEEKLATSMINKSRDETHILLLKHVLEKLNPEEKEK